MPKQSSPKVQDEIQILAETLIKDKAKLKGLFVLGIESNDELVRYAVNLTGNDTLALLKISEFMLLNEICTCDLCIEKEGG